LLFQQADQLDHSASEVTTL